MAHTKPLVTLPFHLTPPTLAQVEASAAASPLLAALTRLREHLGSDGRELTEAGGIVFHGEREVNALLGLPEFHEPDDGPDDRPMCFDPRPRCTLALAIADECGAIETVGNRLVAAAGWDDDDVIVKASVALSTLFDLGPMRTSMTPGEPLLDVRDLVLDGSYINWLATLLPEGRSQTVDHFVDWAIDVCREQFGGDPLPTTGELETWVENGTCYLIDALAWAGAIEWSDREVRRTTLHGGARWFGGGSVQLTALGRHVLPDHLATGGLALRPPDDPSHPSAAGLLGDLLMTSDAAMRREIVSAWRPEDDDSERARLVADELLSADQVPWRWVGFEALDVIGAEAAAPFVRQLLDSPASEDAAQWLVDHGLADADEFRPFLGLGPIIGMLASLAGDPPRLRQWLVFLLEKVEAPELLLEVIALHTTPEATMLLTAAARHVTDPRFAEMIQAAERHHHEWKAECDPAL